MRIFIVILLVCGFVVLYPVWAQDDIVDGFVAPADVFREAVSGSALYINILVICIGGVAIAALCSLRLPMVEELRQNMWERSLAALAKGMGVFRESLSDRHDRLAGDATAYREALDRLLDDRRHELGGGKIET